MPYGFRTPTLADMPMLRRWLGMPEVVRWWGDPLEEEALLWEDLGNDLMTMRIVSVDGRAFAYAQDYDVWSWPQPHFAHLQPGTRAIDAFIGEPDMTPLTDADGPEALALATLTQPGPFFRKTHLLGGFVGVKHGGRLVAMAGERLKPEGFTEVSGVCTHPDFRGRGYAGALIGAVAQRILERGQVPFLHVYAHNTAAIVLYETLGFRFRSEMTFVIMTPAA